MFKMLTSIHGRRLGISSSGGLVSHFGSTGSGSTAFVSAAQMWGTGMLQTVSSAGASINNAGITVISSDSTAGSTPFILQVPAAGLSKEIFITTTATALALDTNSSLVYINSTLGETAAGGSTAFSITGPATGIAGSIVLRGLSATQWAIMSHTVAISS
jgi:hypothetical protein